LRGKGSMLQVLDTTFRAIVRLSPKAGFTRENSGPRASYASMEALGD